MSKLKVKKGSPVTRLRRIASLSLLVASYSLLGLSAWGQVGIYVTNTDANIVTVVDQTTNAVIATIPICNHPDDVLLNPSGTRAYISCGWFGQAGAVAVIDTSTNTVITTITTGLGNFTRGLAVSPDGSRVFVTSIDSNIISVIDAATNTVIGTVYGLDRPVGVVVNPAGTRAYVTNGGTYPTASTVSVIDTFSMAIIATIPVGVSPHNLAISPDGTKLFVPNQDGTRGWVLVIDATTYATLASIDFDVNTTWVAVAPNGKTAYVTSYDNTGAGSVYLIDTTSFTVTGAIRVGLSPYGVAVSSDGKHVYVACWAYPSATNGGLWIIDASTKVVSGSIVLPPGWGAFGVAAPPTASPRYGTCLLYDPTRAARSGSTLPIKLQLCDAQGLNLSAAGIALHATGITLVSTSISGPVNDAGNANPDNNFRFDAGLGGTGGYIFNLKTTGLSTGSYNLNFTVNGDTYAYQVPFQVK
jgi:YVTN family beta-propeller protein